MDSRNIVIEAASMTGIKRPMLNILGPSLDRFDDDIQSDIWLLENSGIFDAPTYRAAAGIPAKVNAARHYLLEGWRLGLEPGPNFEGRFLYPYYRSVGFAGPPALTYVTLVAAGALPELTTQARVEAVAVVVRHSEVFDAAGYAARVGGLLNLDPAMHYVLVGELMGYAPSEKLDPAYYRARYPDVARVANSVHHFTQFGRLEGRRPLAAAWRIPFDVSRIDPARETVVIVSHQASRTGAPILAYNVAKRLRSRYNVVAVLLTGGELVNDFHQCCTAVLGPLTYEDWTPVEADHLVQRLLRACPVKYVIANSIESRMVVPWFAGAFVPTVTLVHEFAAYWPDDAMATGIDWSTQLVFSSKLTVAAAIEKHPALANRALNVLPQGQSELPPRDSKKIAGDNQLTRAAMRPPGAERAFVVLGCGTVTVRKGIDFFLACAANIARFAPTRPVRFVWIGSASGTEADRLYFSFVAEQVTRSGLGGMVSIIPEVTDLSSAYAEADVLFLSSRLDPLPNVAIDASLSGLPVICFEGGTGFAELLASDSRTRISVVPYLDTYAAAGVIAKLADDEAGYKELSEATRQLAERTFDMDRYVGRLDELGQDAIAIMDKRAEDFDTVRHDECFDENIFLPPGASIATREGAVAEFLVRWAAVGLNRRPTINFYFRRPCSGFHPQIYAHENLSLFDSTVTNPLAHFIRCGKPDGPWKQEVIDPSHPGLHAPHVTGLRVALHGHFYYPELAWDLLEKISVNRTRCDLFLTTTDEAKANVLRATLDRYDRGETTIRIVPNRGRDVGAFLTAFAADAIGKYDVIGHVHGKRSLFVSDALGDPWREFLWQNLIGGLYPMFDGIMERFAQDERLGLVFPEDPHLCDWDYNLKIATGLAQKMGIETPLPPFFNFPVGTMFWARTLALAPLFDLALGWDDYPEEPVPIDGTMLHALERLFPFVAHRAGYRYATTNVPGITW